MYCVDFVMRIVDVANGNRRYEMYRGTDQRMQRLAEFIHCEIRNFGSQLPIRSLRRGTGDDMEHFPVSNGVDRFLQRGR